MRRQNQEGPALLGTLPEPPALQPNAFARLVIEGALVVDCRAPEAFAGAHIPGSLNVGAGTSFPVWAGSVLPADAETLLVMDDPGQLQDLYWKLLRIGYREPVGWLAGGIRAWQMAGEPTGALPLWTPRELEGHRRECATYSFSTCASLPNGMPVMCPGRIILPAVNCPDSSKPYPGISPSRSIAPAATVRR